MPNTGQLVTRNITRKRQGVATAHRDISYTNYSSRNKARKNDSQSAARPLTTYLEISAAWLATLITSLPYCRFSSRLVDRLLQIVDGGAA